MTEWPFPNSTIARMLRRSKVPLRNLVQRFCLCFAISLTYGSPAERLRRRQLVERDCRYLKHSEETVRRWQEEGLPVHRHAHKKRAGLRLQTRARRFGERRPCTLEELERAQAARRRGFLASNGPNPVVTCESSWRHAGRDFPWGLIASFFWRHPHFCYG